MCLTFGKTKFFKKITRGTGVRCIQYGDQWPVGRAGAIFGNRLRSFKKKKNDGDTTTVRFPRNRRLSMASSDVIITRRAQRAGKICKLWKK